VEAIMSAPISSEPVRGALAYAPKWARQQATETDFACESPEEAAEDAPPHIPIAKSASESHAAAQDTAGQDTVPKSSTAKSAAVNTAAAENAAARGVVSDAPWWRGRPRIFEGDVAIVELRERLKLVPDQIPEPPLRRATRTPLAAARRFALVATAAAVAFGCYSLWTPREQTAAPRFEAASYEPSSAGSAQAAAVLPATAATTEFATVPQAPAPILRPIEPLRWPARQGNDAAAGDVAAGIGTSTRATSPRPADAKAGAVSGAPAHEVEAARASAATRNTYASGVPVSGAPAIKNPSAAMATPSGVIAAAPPALTPTARQPAMEAKVSEALLARAQTYLMNGDVAAARLVLRRAAEADVARAALALGDTYDPLVLKQLGVVGIVGDPKEAREWYRRAAELGSPDAPQRLLAENRGQPAEDR
jgi:hypothetical protein